MVTRIWSFFVTRLVIATIVFYRTWRLGELAWTAALSRAPSGIVDRAIGTLAAIVAMLIVGGVIERHSAAELGFRARNALRALGSGVLLGAGVITAMVGGMAMCGWYTVTSARWQDPSGDALTFAVFGLFSYFLVAVLEEVLFRGMLFRIVEGALGTWLALGVSAVIFGGMHLLNENASLWSATAIALEAGVLFGATYIFTRALWMPIGLHWGWNYFEGYVYGTPVSGAQQPGLLLSSVNGPELWTGGAFGPEGWLIALLVSGAACVLMLTICIRKERVFPPTWQWRGGFAPDPQARPA